MLRTSAREGDLHAMGLRNDTAMSRRSCHHPAWETGLGCWLLAVATARHCWSDQPAATLHGSARAGLWGLQEWCWDLGGADWGSRKGKILLRGTAYILKSKITSAREILPAKAGVPGKQFWKSFELYTWPKKKPTTSTPICGVVLISISSGNTAPTRLGDRRPPRAPRTPKSRELIRVSLPL